MLDNVLANNVEQQISILDGWCGEPRLRALSCTLAILSLMVDEVSGIEEIVTIWQEYYRVVDWTVSCAQKMGRFYFVS